jgi:hypothetical protein
MTEQQTEFPNLDHESLENKESHVPIVNDDDYSRAMGEDLSETLDISTWQSGVDLVGMYQRVEQEVAESVRAEHGLEHKIRSEVFPKLGSRPNAPASAGLYRATSDMLKDVHRQILFNGGVEACDGTVVSHDTLPLTITQVGICLVSYSGDQGSWVHRMYRRDMRSENPIDTSGLLDLLDSREKRSAVGSDQGPDKLTSLARRGIMGYAERAVLLDMSKAVWRMGHGSPVPYELLTGSGMVKLLDQSITLLNRFIEEQKKFVFVPSAITGRVLPTLGQALDALEYLVVETMEDAVLKIVKQGHYTGQWRQYKSKLQDFARTCGRDTLRGIYRVSKWAPPQIFYAHKDYVHEAALIAMSDSVLQQYRGFPMLIDLADQTCSASFGPEVFNSSMQLAYANSGSPYCFMPERSTRR